MCVCVCVLKGGLWVLSHIVTQTLWGLSIAEMSINAAVNVRLPKDV